MNTPILDFTGRYLNSGALRFHMPGHKGKELLGFEKWDLTEITGADSLYECEGIIKESEKNASELFGCESYYSTEGSSQCIRAMLYLALMDAKLKGSDCRILCARNAHRTFLYGAAALDLDVCWLYGNSPSYLSCIISPEMLEKEILDQKPSAVYITSPDYLGNIQDIEALSAVCHKYGVLLLVDNAHGAYLKFREKSLHPIDLGADICCDSAHKTLPVLTGGAYLHLSHRLSPKIRESAKEALALFGSTSPSYLILQSLDRANLSLSSDFPKKLHNTELACMELKEALKNHGYRLFGDEALKISISSKDYGYPGYEMQEILEAQGIYTEFADPDFLVLMISPENTPRELEVLKEALLNIPGKEAIKTAPPLPFKAEKILSVKEACLSLSETVNPDEAVGRILASPSVSCPPAVPILVCGEKITAEAAEAFKYYGINKIRIVSE